eukprot:CAMPEP_0198143984 /NCGR_PEP_ID=MMETSP1443-20131203/12340_1 /TAXON_ID=186043 /ORGANISM="Entomoneis sp., Strain CCMP2396" /LENGTH=357 /DNA_ID=CAMNT_0043807301 /DNA_START=92 /DNA_END=1162 /DNA_ORIENTATION=+
MKTFAAAVIALTHCARLATGLSAPDASLSRARLGQAFSSPSGKLTYSPELLIPEPNDPTAILLQSNAIQGLSGKIRQGKANAVFFKGSLTALKTFCMEQESARGNFPGPVAVIYCADEGVEISSVADAGAEGLLINVCDGVDITGVEDVNDDSDWINTCKEALTCGIQPVPEFTLKGSDVESWDEEVVTKMVSKITGLVGEEPIAVLLTVNYEETDETTDADEDEQESQNALPSVSKELSRKIPIIGSVRADAGDGRLGAEANRFKEAGFSSALLRSECVPGFRIQLDLDIVGSFWAGCIVDLKSTKSKSFSFRSKNKMEKSVATEWRNYQKSVIDEGSLGDPSESESVVDSEAGDY